ncbi:unnamed protein product [Cuscuta campestris]|uniref:Aminotransferase-like plant mobile domain-containing protein n=1 Tax=Cuscuta campestris TaxID=132261 RepID=A0A484N0P1_9ASTE|nr:unnamed protein product [Cuscuta campestris]
MRMLRWMCGKTRLDMISNEVIRRQVGMAPVEDKLWEARLRWFGHVRRRDADAPVWRCERITVIGGSRGRGRPRKNWKEVEPGVSWKPPPYFRVGARWKQTKMYSASARQNVRYFRNQLDSLQFRNVVWKPYDIDNFPAYCRRSPQLWTFQGYVIYRSMIDPVMPMRFTRQFGMLQTIPELTHPYTEAYHKTKGCKSTHSVQACVAQWRDNRFALTVFHEMEPIVGENPFQITVEYAHWFATHGRRIIGNPYHRPLEGSENTSAKLAFLVNTIKKAERRLGKVPGAVAVEVRDSLRGALENVERNEDELVEDDSWENPYSQLPIMLYNLQNSYPGPVVDVVYASEPPNLNAMPEETPRFNFKVLPPKRPTNEIPRSGRRQRNRYQGEMDFRARR